MRLLSLTKRAAVILNAVCLSSVIAACATTKGPTTYQPVALAVATSCVPPALGPKPPVETPKELAALPDGPTRLVRLAAAYLTLYARSLETEAVVQGCR
ncbi:MAG: hypothetical protein JWQ97_3901 [Phenylobacterium sp.]|nr:hypothetical protein [Phenylobacterium sp.]